MPSALLQFAEAQVQAARLQLAAAERLLEEARRSELEARQTTHRETDQWVYLPALCQRIGLTEHAVRGRIAAGTFVEGIHWRRERPGTRTRQIFNIAAIQACLSGKPASAIPASSSTMTSSASGFPTRASDVSNPSA